MPVTIPEKTDASIGRVLQDRPRPLPADLRYEIPAETFERIKDAIIANATAVNEAGGGPVWQWNGTDLSQFASDSPIHFEDDIGNEAGSAAASVVTDDWDQAVIRLSTTGLSGVWVMPVLEAEYLVAAFPRGVVIEAVFGAASATTLHPVVGVLSDDEGGDAEGLLANLTLGSNTARLYSVFADAIQDVDTLGLDNPGTMDLNAMACGIRVRLELWMSDAMQDPDGAPGETVLGYRAHLDVWAQDGHKHGAGATGLTGYVPLTSTTGEPMDKVVIGVWAANTGQTQTLDILDLKIYAHPMDRSA